MAVHRYPVLSLPKHVVEDYRRLLFKCRLVDKDTGFKLAGERLEIPLAVDLDLARLDAVMSAECTGQQDTPLPLASAGALIKWRTQPRPVVRPVDPATRIVQRLRDMGFAESVLKGLPKKWELFGDVLVLRLDTPFERQVAAVYAEELGAATVLAVQGGIEGQFRRPSMRVVHGSRTLTVHTENGIRYRFDVARIMFSSGNVDERIRMGCVDARKETVVDMFAGIGYFSLPLAVHAGAARVFALELNPVAFEYLEQNIRLNGVEDIVVPVLGDNRSFEMPHGSLPVDRIVMGYFHTTHLFLPKAMSLLGERGVIHFHDTCPVEDRGRRALAMVEEAAVMAGYHIASHSWRAVKSYAPGIDHIVLDVRLERTKA